MTALSCSASQGRPTLLPDLRVLVRLRSAGRLALDLLLPPRCGACDESVSVHGQLCSACFSGTNFISEPFCSRCSAPFASVEQAGDQGECPACAENVPVFRQTRAALRYDDQCRRLILPLKHGDRIELAAILAPMMARAGAALLRNADLLVPVPLHRRRLFERKYNQAALLASAIGRLTGRLIVADGLMRLRRTAPLEQKSPEERALEVAGSFQVKPSRAAQFIGRKVVLVDDVMTSGSTANACAAALLQAGAAAVDVLVAARVPDPRLS